MTPFEEAVSSFTDSCPFYAAVQELRAELLRERPAGVTTTEIGHLAWRQLTPVQQAHALDGLFHVYLMRLHDEDIEQQRSATSATVTTYIEGDEETELWSALNAVPRPIEDDATVDKVPAYALANVLSELDLIRHRLAMTRKQNGEGE